jgi:hypothetical protein
MTYRYKFANTSRNTSAKKGFSFGLQPAPAWTAILGLVFLTIAAIFAGGGSILRLLFPIASFAVGILLYLRYPALYIGFTWWMWMLTPFVRRIIDYRIGWDSQGLILLAPYLVTFITFFTFVRYLPKSYRMGGLPFIMAGLAVFYALLIGIVRYQPILVIRNGLEWIGPILFGFHFFVNWQEYPNYRQTLQRTFLWGVLVTGAYAVVQFLLAPEWDRLWLIESGMTSSAGRPEPLQIRVWSTMHAPGPFAGFMMGALLLLFSSKEPLSLPANLFGYLGFLLAMVRSCWGGWLVGLITLLTSVKAKLQMRLTVTILVMVLCVLPLATMEPFSKTLTQRFQTFTNLEKDSSFKARSTIYDEQLNIALSQGLGNGIGNAFILNKQGKLEVFSLDSGILDMFFTLGWFGAIFYLTGLIMLLFSTFQYPESRFDSFMSACRAVVVSICVTLPLGSAMLGITGLMLWGFLGLCMAGHKYHQHQKRNAGLQRR